MQIRVLALDLPGHGESGMKEKEDFSIRSFVQHVKQVRIEILCLIFNFHVMIF